MSFELDRGETETVYRQRPASQAFDVGDAVVINSSGNVVPASASDGTVFGIAYENVSSTDDDYADSGVKIPVRVPREEDVRWRVETTGGAVQGDVGNDIDLSDEATVNRGSTSNGAVEVQSIIDADNVIVSLNTS